MSIRRVPLILLTACLTLLVSGPSCGQVPPNSLDSSITQALQLSTAQRDRIDVYVAYYAGQIASSDNSSVTVEAARAELLKPLGTAGGPTPTFVLEYATSIVPALEPVISAEDRPHAAMNSMIVLGRLASRRAMDVLLRHANQRNETRIWIRTGAANNLARSLDRLQPGQLNPRDIAFVLRGLRSAVTNEDDPIVMRHLLRSMAAVNTPESRADYVNALSAVVEKIRKHPDAESPLVESFYVAIANLRNRFIQLRKDEQEAISAKLNECLYHFLESSQAKWNSAHGDPALMATWAAPIRTSEAILKISVPVSRGRAPGTQLRTHWENGARQRFEQEVELWHQVAIR